MRRSQNQNQKNKNNRKYDERQDDDEDYIKPKKTFQHNRYNEYNNNENDLYNYDNRPIRANSGMVPKANNFKKNNNYRNYEDNYEYNNNEKKKGNSNILNCVINLLKELSPNELKIVNREIDRINNY